MRLDRHAVGIGAVVNGQAIIYVRDARGSIWTRAFPNSATVADDAYSAWLRDQEGWHYTPGDLDIKEISLVYESGPAALLVSGMGSLTHAKLAESCVDVIVSLTPLSADAFREVVVAQRRIPTLRHHACPVRDLTPDHWGEADNTNARRALEATLLALREGKRVLVHCLMGIHRSPALAMVAISGMTGQTLKESAQLVMSKRALAQWIPPTAERIATFLPDVAAEHTLPLARPGE